MFDEETEVGRRAVNPVHEEHRNLAGIVRLEKVHAGTDIENEVIRFPQAVLRMLSAETWIVERGKHPVGRRRAQTLLKLSPSTTSLELHEIDLPFQTRPTLDWYD